MNRIDEEAKRTEQTDMQFVAEIWNKPGCVLHKWQRQVSQLNLVPPVQIERPTWSRIRGASHEPYHQISTLLPPPKGGPIRFFVRHTKRPSKLGVGLGAAAQCADSSDRQGPRVIERRSVAAP